jgi:hypothetical protein
MIQKQTYNKMAMAPDEKIAIKAARQRQDELFYELLSLVTTKLEGNYKDLTKRAHPDLSINRIQNVRYGRPRDLSILVKIVQSSLPGFAISEKYLAAIPQGREHSLLVAA